MSNFSFTSRNNPKYFDCLLKFVVQYVFIIYIWIQFVSRGWGSDGCKNVLKENPEQSLEALIKSSSSWDVEAENNKRIAFIRILHRKTKIDQFSVALLSHIFEFHLNLQIIIAINRSRHLLVIFIIQEDSRIRQWFIICIHFHSYKRVLCIWKVKCCFVNLNSLHFQDLHPLVFPMLDEKGRQFTASIGFIT